MYIFMIQVFRLEVDGKDMYIPSTSRNNLETTKENLVRMKKINKYTWLLLKYIILIGCNEDTSNNGYYKTVEFIVEISEVIETMSFKEFNTETPSIRIYGLYI